MDYMFSKQRKTRQCLGVSRGSRNKKEKEKEKKLKHQLCIVVNDIQTP